MLYMKRIRGGGGRPQIHVAAVAAGVLLSLAAGVAGNEAPLAGQSDAPEAEAEDTQAMLQLKHKESSTIESVRTSTLPPSSWSPSLPEKTRQCIQDSVKKPFLPTLKAYWEGKGKNPATVCAVVAKPGNYHGIPGRNSLGWPIDMGDWDGKEVGRCVEGHGRNCKARHLINQYNDSTVQDYPGTWFTTNRGWGDGKPSAVLEYQLDALPNYHDELRPWCTCGVKVYLGMFFWFQRGEQDNVTHPTSSFALVPPDAKPNDCPKKKCKKTMCQSDR